MISKEQILSIPTFEEAFKIPGPTNFDCYTINNKGSSIDDNTRNDELLKKVDQQISDIEKIIMNQDVILSKLP